MCHLTLQPPCLLLNPSRQYVRCQGEQVSHCQTCGRDYLAFHLGHQGRIGGAGVGVRWAQMSLQAKDKPPVSLCSDGMLVADDLHCLHITAVHLRHMTLGCSLRLPGPKFQTVDLQSKVWSGSVAVTWRDQVVELVVWLPSNLVGQWLGCAVVDSKPST